MHATCRCLGSSVLHDAVAPTTWLDPGVRSVEARTGVLNDLVLDYRMDTVDPARIATIGSLQAT
jgi:hypothetical protein